MLRVQIALWTALAVAAPAARAAAQPDLTGSIRFEVDKERAPRQKILIAALVGGSLLVGSVGLLFHLDSRAKSDEVSASRPTGRVYTPALDDTRRDALRSRNLAIATYGAAGGLLIASFVAYVLTDPGKEVIELDGDGAASAAAAAFSVEPLAGGGAVVGGGWRF